MPFRARCMFCKHGVRVPDNAVGASVKCPKCASFFTIVPVEDDEPTSSRPTPQATDFTASAPMATAVATMPATPALPDPLPATDRPSPWLDPLGILALLLGGAALLGVSVYALGVVVRPAAALGLLVGLAGVAVALLADRPRPFIAIAGTLLNAVVLWLALFVPRWLGPTYHAYREAVVDDPTVIRVVALPDQPPRGEAVGPEGVAADKAALQQG